MTKGIKFTFHPAFDRPKKSGEYLVFTGATLLSMSYSKKYDAWNAHDDIPLHVNNRMSIVAWACIPDSLKNLNGVWSRQY